MKKLLSVLLAVLMIFSVLSVSAFASVDPAADAKDIMKDNTAGSSKTHVVVHYNIGTFTLTQPMPVYNANTGMFDSINGLTGSYYQIPRTALELYVEGPLYLPTAVGNESLQFSGWFCQKTGQYFVGGTTNTIDGNMIDPYTGCIELTAYGVPAQAEEDTLGNIVGILTKVFGAIIGILFYNGNTAAGVELVAGILGGLDL